MPIIIDHKMYVRFDNGVDVQCPRCWTYDLEHWEDFALTGEADTEKMVYVKESIECLACGHTFTETSRALLTS